MKKSLLALMLAIVLVSLTACGSKVKEPEATATPVVTEAPTAEPTEEPTAEPTEAPTAVPTEAPTAVPTEAPTAEPTEAPTAVPTEAPTAEPTAVPTEAPTEAPAATEEPVAEEAALTLSDDVLASAYNGAVTVLKSEIQDEYDQMLSQYVAYYAQYGYSVDEYDLAGFSVGAVDKEKVLDKKTMRAGDVVIGLASSGVHSNGFSLVRKVLDVENADLTAPVDALGGASLGETLLTPTKIYVKPMLALFDAISSVRGISHITGGGFYENIPRSIPDGLCAKIQKDAVPVLPIFKLIAARGEISEHDMFNTFNMGIDMTVIVAKEDAERACAVLADAGETPYVLGEIVTAAESGEKVSLCEK